mmetsp:Transcript_71245/g.133253  ORF Transcript_71245/g.133253 Transcript_71245/m.133253 type:complete len:294 (+) Transcript_71245:77-958(+)
MAEAATGQQTGASFEALLDQGVPRAEAGRMAVRVTFNEVFQATFQRLHQCYFRLIVALLLGLMFVLAWVYLQLDDVDTTCDQPLPFMIRVIYVLIMIQGLKRELVRCFLCYNMSGEQPEPCRVRVFKWLLGLAALFWPLVALVMVLRAKACDVVVIHCTELLILSYLVIVFVVFVLPASIVSVMFFLITRGCIRLPRSENAAPEGFLDQLPLVTYSAELFSDENPEGYTTACSICLDDFTAEQPIVKTPCPATARGHVFHKECLRGWLDMSKQCPLCRTDLVSATPEAVSDAA